MAGELGDYNLVVAHGALDLGVVASARLVLVDKRGESTFPWTLSGSSLVALLGTAFGSLVLFNDNHILGGTANFQSHDDRL